MDLWINIANNELHVLLQQLDGFIINDSEAELITGISDPIAAGQKILELGPSFVIVKKGEYGSVLVDKNNTAVLPAFPLAIEDVIDPTGAGDSFAGGFMGYIATVQEINFEEMRTAMAWGTVTASFTLQSFGLDGIVKASKDKIRSRMVEFTEFAK
jgi:sugar/nucleoside kinase (ribokinase family)